MVAQREKDVMKGLEVAGRRPGGRAKGRFTGCGEMGQEASWFGVWSTLKGKTQQSREEEENHSCYEDTAAHNKGLKSN